MDRIPTNNRTTTVTKEQEGNQAVSGVDAAGFNDFVVHYSSRIFWFFFNRTRSHEESKDLTQETFLRAYQGYADFETRGKDDSWLKTIAQRVWINFNRHQSAQKRDGFEFSLEALLACGGLPADARSSQQMEADPLNQMLLREKALLLGEALKSLPLRMRQCMVMHLFQDRKYEEIALAMNLSLGTVKSHIFQGRAKLKQIMNHLEGKEVDGSEA